MLKHMIHRPCGKDNPNAPCMRNGFCSKNFPKDFLESTCMSEDGYPIYRRRDNGDVAVKLARGRPFQVDNRYVVAHNRQLLVLLDCHVNVEICSTIKAIKRVFSCSRICLIMTCALTVQYNKVAVCL